MTRVDRTPDYDSFASRIQQTGWISDPWIAGEPRFREAPVVLSSKQRAALEEAAESVAKVYDELARIVDAHPEHLEDHFGLTEVQRALWLTSAPAWHGIARADAFFVDGTVRICEVNSDTPSGEAEAVLLNRLVAADHPGLKDPNAGFESRFCKLLEEMLRAFVPEDSLRRVALVYPTEMPEDLSMIGLYEHWLREGGFDVMLGSPFNLELDQEGRVSLFGVPCSLMLRHYKTDWWSERRSPWLDEVPPPDEEPLTGPLGAVLSAQLLEKVAIVNPFGSVMTQNKRSLAFLWEHLAEFSNESRDAILRYIPRTLRLESIDRVDLLRERESWVLKSDYGCEGDEVILGIETSEEIWRASLEQAAPKRWVVQAYFRSDRDPSGAETNHGVYLLGGQAAGFFTRIQPGVTDTHALCAATLVAEGEA